MSDEENHIVYCNYCGKVQVIVHPYDDERKPWEDDPTGPAPKNQPVFVSIDLFAIGRWFKRWRNEKRNKKRNQENIRDGQDE